MPQSSQAGTRIITQNCKYESSLVRKVLALQQIRPDGSHKRDHEEESFFVYGFCLIFILGQLPAKQFFRASHLKWNLQKAETFCCAAATSSNFPKYAWSDSGAAVCYA